MKLSHRYYTIPFVLLTIFTFSSVSFATEGVDSACAPKRCDIFDEEIVIEIPGGTPIIIQWQECRLKDRYESCRNEQYSCQFKPETNDDCNCKPGTGTSNSIYFELIEF